MNFCLPVCSFLSFTDYHSYMGLMSASYISQSDVKPLANGFIHRPASERGMADHGWLQSAHSFSFANYYDPNHMGFENLRVINEDKVAPKMGFGTHPHRNAEIFSYIIDGQLAHEDTLRNSSIVEAGAVQYMSAGHGVRHSEFNPSDTAPVHFLQIWLTPNQSGGEPHYATQDISFADKDGKLALFLSPNGRDGSMAMRADADVYAACLNKTQTIETELAQTHKAWVQVARGHMFVNGQALSAGDGLAITQSGRLIFTANEAAECLYFDLYSGQT